ncbi:MAG: galactokinase [Ginsengibacter sp.]
MKEKIARRFSELFHEKPLIVRSPGRINVIGEHTDYNEGFVLPAAIDKAAYLGISLRNDNQIHLVADDLNKKYSLTLEDLQPVKEVNWPNFILGAVAQFVKKGIPLKGFNAVLMSDIPIGAGMSSSAAIECATTFALNELFQANLDRITMVKMAQKAEHEYAGVMCGIMDQFASMMGKEDCVIKMDCQTLEYDYVPFKLKGVKILLLNTNVKHSLASSEYNIRRKECEQAVAWIKEHEPNVSSLRNANEEMLNKYVLPKDRIIDMRSRFIVQEIDRLQKACKDLQRGDLKALGQRMFATHEGLSKMYGVSCKELDFLVEFAKNDEAVIGARMMGGGFGGCTINLVREGAVDQLLESVIPAYEKYSSLKLSHYIVSPGKGTEII